MIKQYIKKIHMIGIGGAGMSPLAEVLQTHGHVITGSDKNRSYVTERMESLGIKVQFDHEPQLLKSADLVVYSSAVKKNNPEREYALKNGIPQIRRAELLGQLMRSHFSICISGTHGKTTTTSLIGTIFHDAGSEPTVLVGGKLKSKDAHAVVGKGKVLIAEADEYDRSFLAMYPSMAVVTNIEADHLDCYQDLSSIKDAFLLFAERIPFYGALIVCSDDSGTQELINNTSKTVITYGIRSRSDYRAVNVKVSKGKTAFDVVSKDVFQGSIQLNLPGMHNVLNSLAAIAVANEMGIDFSTIKKSLENFEGVDRRFEVVGKEKGITVVDDYAHHPGEIKATLDAASQSGYNRTIAVFQPHLYSRTRDFMDEFAKSLTGADISVVIDIYKAREEPIRGISSEGIVEKMKELGFENAHYIADKSKLIGFICENAADGDAVIMMGAGDIWKIARESVRALKDG